MPELYDDSYEKPVQLTEKKQEEIKSESNCTYAEKYHEKMKEREKDPENTL